ncbi:hypothetical protein ScPMuIL_014168 [Solemya velum]
MAAKSSYGEQSSSSGHWGHAYLEAAKLESLKSGRLTPLIKLELKCRIQTRRLSEGKDELDVEFTPPQKTMLTVEEKCKRLKRLQQNKEAARKCREKKKQNAKIQEEKFEQLQKKNGSLRDQLKCLEEEKIKVMQLLGIIYPTMSSQESPTPEACPESFQQRALSSPTPSHFTPIPHSCLQQL